MQSILLNQTFMKTIFLFFLLFNLNLASSLQKQIQNIDNPQLKPIFQQLLTIIEKQNKTIQKQNQEIIKLKTFNKNKLDNLESEIQIQADELEEIQNKKDFSLSIKGYTNTDFVFKQKKNKQQIDSFDQAETTLFLNANKDRFRFFSEIEWSHSGTNIHQERSWIEYQSNSSLKLRLGQSLIPSYWNLNHYPHVAISINKPYAVGKIMPFNYIGAQITGQNEYKQANIEYILYTGNGIDSIDNPTPSFANSLNGTGRDKNSSKAFGQKATFSFPSFNHLDFSVHHYKDSRDLNYLGIPLLNRGSYEVYQIESKFTSKRWDLLLSHTQSKLKSQGLRSNKQYSSYYQVNYNDNSPLNYYLRFEHIDADSSLNSIFDQSRQLIGLNYRYKPYTGVKLELLTIKPKILTNSSYNEFWTSLYFAF
ncbi:MAG: hypothetical protein COB02_11610 [Candidatus Cloacimonadota bacterium]|nr:MAG: hypothetical protein COB02_11610 [Candidatus Cloacimonadota bacterium]